MRNFQSARRIYRMSRVRIQHDRGQQALRKVGEGETIASFLPRTRRLDQSFDLRLSESEFSQRLRQNRVALRFIRPLEDQNIRRPALYSRIERAQAVGAHDDGRREPAIADTVNATNERIHPSAVFMVHLCGFARLRERIGFIDERMMAPLAFPELPFSLPASATV